MIYKGFKFGMLLQLAIGPICLFIFQAASTGGFLIAMTGVLGVALVDTLYILASIIGVGTLIERNASVKVGLKIFGAVVLTLFGLSNILSTVGIDFLPALQFQSIQNTSNMFVRTALLTLSNPLTIVFWAGAFSSKIAEENFERRDLYPFGGGAVLATLLFMSIVVGAGSFTKTFLPAYMIEILNGIVGVVLIYFGVRTALKKV